MFGDAQKELEATLLAQPIVRTEGHMLLAVELRPKICGSNKSGRFDFWGPLEKPESVSDERLAAYSSQVAALWMQWYHKGVALKIALPLRFEGLTPERLKNALVAPLQKAGVPMQKLEFVVPAVDIETDLNDSGRLTQTIQDFSIRLNADLGGLDAQTAGRWENWPISSVWLTPETSQDENARERFSTRIRTARGIGSSPTLPCAIQHIDSQDDLKCLPAGECDAIQGRWIANAMLPDLLLDWIYANRWQRELQSAVSQSHQPETTSPAPAIEMADASKISAFVVDDDPIIRMTLLHQLAQLGITRVVEAGSGSEAKRILDEPQDFSLFFCDLKMPGVDGIELLRGAAEKIPQANVVIISSVDEKTLHAAATLAKTHNLQLLGTLQKPVRMTALRGLLARMSLLGQTHAPKSGLAVTLDELTLALQDGAVQAYFQPQIAVDSGRLVGAEALVRWEHPQGLLSPGQFLPLAQQHGLMPALTTKMLRDSLKALQSWQRKGLNLEVAVNLTMDILEDLEFPDRLLGLCEMYGVPPHKLKLEITETSACKNFASTLDVVTRLRLKGFSLAIDDFGTGYSDQATLRDIPFDVLKIDQAFVSSATVEKQSRLLVQNNIRLAHGLNMQCLAEGVETAETWMLLQELGCDRMQGFIVSRALSPDAFLKWAAEYADRLLMGELPPHRKPLPQLMGSFYS